MMMVGDIYIFEYLIICQRGSNTEQTAVGLGHDLREHPQNKDSADETQHSSMSRHQYQTNTEIPTEYLSLKNHNLNVP